MHVVATPAHARADGVYKARETEPRGAASAVEGKAGEIELDSKQLHRFVLRRGDVGAPALLRVRAHKKGEGEFVW